MRSNFTLRSQAPLTPWSCIIEVPLSSYVHVVFGLAAYVRAVAPSTAVAHLEMLHRGNLFGRFRIQKVEPKINDGLPPSAGCEWPWN